MSSEEEKHYRRFVKIWEEFLEEKLSALPLRVRYRFITDLLALTMEGKRDEAFDLLLAFLKGYYQPSLKKKKEKNE